MEKNIIPKCMSTQHPDNVNLPFFAESPEMGGNDEIQEAYYVYSHLGCEEQMWDCEGKEVDNYVVRKLLTKYENYFKEKKLGQEVFLTLRVPNPTVERPEAKILLETLESIPRSFDAARIFYGREICPIFEVVLPMTASAKCLDRIYRYYRDFVAGKETKKFADNDITIGEWTGQFRPKKINVIPLFEDYDHMIKADEITAEYLKDKKTSHQRIFLARSDPAMNYGLVTAVLLNKIALKKLENLSHNLEMPIYPIVGVGSAPFRGNLRPQNIENVCREYPSVQTFTIQSSFKYDNPPDAVEMAIDRLKKREIGQAHEVEIEKFIELMHKYTAEYQKQVQQLAPVINKMASFAPGRRKRKLHVGLFGYSRSHNEITLPRAINFTLALYSIGLPPELLGLNALTAKDIEYLKNFYVNFDYDLAGASAYFNEKSKFIPKELNEKLQLLSPSAEPDEAHCQITKTIIDQLESNKTSNLSDLILEAANRRKFLG